MTPLSFKIIRLDCNAYLLNIRNALRESGVAYVEISQWHLGVEFKLNNKWMLEVDCERFGSGVTISIKNTDFGRKDGYAIWILMLAFECLTGIRYGDPTIENQINFLKNEQPRIFESCDFYDNEYSRLNDM